MRVIFIVMGLLALGPQAVSAQPRHAACPEPEARQFDFWIGAWDVSNRYFVQNQSWVSAGVATNLVHPVLDGCAIAEHWSGNLGRQQIRGFSIRTYDPDRKKWVLLLSWPNPNRPTFSFLEGSFRHGRGEFFREGIDQKGDSILTRYTFSDITDESLRWDAATSADEGVSWATNWIMEFSRRDENVDAPVLNAPSYTAHRCTQPEMRAMDDLHGLWETAGRQPKSPGTVSMQIVPILKGCAQMELLTVRGTDATFKSFIVRAYLPDEKQWTGYLLTTVERTFVELFGDREENRVTFSAERGPSHTYRLTGDGQMQLDLDVAGLPELEDGAMSLVRR